MNFALLAGVAPLRPSKIITLQGRASSKKVTLLTGAWFTAFEISTQHNLTLRGPFAKTTTKTTAVVVVVVVVVVTVVLVGVVVGNKCSCRCCSSRRATIHVMLFL